MNRKKPESQSLFSQRPQDWTFIENKTFQHRCFPVNFLKILRTSFFIEHYRWLLLHRKKLKKILSFFLHSLFFSLKKIHNILSIFSFPCFAIHNRKLSQEMCFMLPVYDTGQCTRRSKKEATVRLFRRVFQWKIT